MRIFIFRRAEIQSKKSAGKAYYQFNLYDPIFLEEFDSICAFDVLEHIDEDKLVLKNMYKCLKPGGFLFITVPACKKLWSITDEFAKHRRRYSSKELKEKVESSGFKVLKLSYFMTFLFPFIAFSRIVSRSTFYKKLNNTDFKTQTFTEIEIDPILNQLFYLIFRIEAQFIPFVNFTFGSNLLLVAIKRKD
jgi:2-polyprenyl-3-methyl-5-hydroxy-6-metoxy-1,4-benzoquinol methylase